MSDAAKPGRKVKFGILGTGRMAAAMVAHIRESGNSEVCAVSGPDAQASEAFAARHGIARACPGHRELVLSPEVDAVYVALPNSLHFEHSLLALEQGKHVLCEKPLVLGPEQFERLAAAAGKRGLQLMECLWYRFHPLFESVRSSVRQDLGEPLGFYSTFSFLNQSESDIRWDTALGGGALNDLLCYNIDALNFIFGPDLPRPETLEAFSRQRNGVDANISVELLFPGGLQALLTSSIDRPSVNRTTIVGSKATLVIPHLRVFPDNKAPFFWLVRNGETTKIASSSVNAYAGMVKAFSLAVLEGRVAPIDLRESEKNLLLLEQIRAGLKLEMPDRTALFPKVKRKFAGLLSRIQRKRT